MNILTRKEPPPSTPLPPRENRPEVERFLNNYDIIAQDNANMRAQINNLINDLELERRHSAKLVEEASYLRADRDRLASGYMSLRASMASVGSVIEAAIKEAKQAETEVPETILPDQGELEAEIHKLNTGRRV